MNKRYTLPVLLLIPLLFLSSCKEKGFKGLQSIFSEPYVDMEAFISKMKTAYPYDIDTADSSFKSRLSTDMDLAVQYTYQLNGYRPVWISEQGFREAGRSIADSILSLKDEGIMIDSFMLSLNHIVPLLKTGNSISLDSLLVLDLQLTKAYLEAAHQLLMGRDMKTSDKQWFIANDPYFFGPEYLAHAVSSEKAFPLFDTFRPAIKEYRLILEEISSWQQLQQDPHFGNLKSAVNPAAPDSLLLSLIQKETGMEAPVMKDSLSPLHAWISTYQELYQLKPTGKLDEKTIGQLKKSPEAHIEGLQLNLERLRGLPRDLGREYIWVNIPQMELDYVRDDNVQFHSRVIVGKPARPTPSISSLMTNIVFNPPWGVPPTILKNDVGPGLARRGSGYLARKGLRAYDSRGRDVTSSVNSSNYRKFHISQPPGARNALGDIKFNMPNKEAIYIHDTPHREQFTASYRALSSGCVRTENPKQLAESILENRFRLSTIDSIISVRKTVSQEVSRKLPVYIVYLTVAPNKGGKRMRYLQDIYGRDVKVKKG